MDLLAMDSILSNLVENRTQGLRILHILHQLTQLVRGQNFDDGAEHGAILHLLVEQRLKLIFRQHRNNIIQKSVQATTGHGLITSSSYED